MSTPDAPWDTPAAPTQALVDAYRATHYTVKSAVAVTLRVDLAVPDLDKWLDAHGARTAVVITAYAPFSQVVPDAENERRNAELLAAIKNTGLQVADAEGKARTGDWPVEPSFCVFDSASHLVDEWMRRFGQYAVVVATKGEGCSLLWHPDFRQTTAPAQAQQQRVATANAAPTLLTSNETLP